MIPIGTIMQNFLLLLLLPLSLFAAKPALHQELRPLMGTYIMVKAPEPSMIGPAFERLAEVNDVFSTYKPDSPISRLNETKRLEHPPAILLELLERSAALWEETGGVFDVGVGAVTKDLYRFGTDGERVPSGVELEEAVAAGSFGEVVFTKEEIRLPVRVKLDFGGIAKGYGVDLAAAELSEQGAKAGVVAASGDIRCLHKCEMGIVNPKDDEKTLFTLRALRPDLSFSTSGTYRRYVEDQSHNHLIDPKTGKSAAETLSLTLITVADNTRIDALATALTVMPWENARAFLDHHDELAWVRVDRSGKVEESPNLSKFAERVSDSSGRSGK